MVDNQKKRFDELFQNFFPLKIVDPDKIPRPENLYDFTECEIDFYIKLAVNMQILCSVKNGYGLSAVQCGIPVKLFVTNDGTSQFRTFIDCVYVGLDEKKNSLEGCLSLRNSNGSIKRFMVPRHEYINVVGYELFINAVNKKLDSFDSKFSGISSIIMQHEIDHQNGILIEEIGQEVEVF